MIESNGEGDHALQEKVALPPSLLSLLDSTTARVDGFLMVPFRYQGSGLGKSLYQNRIAVTKECIINSSFGMSNDYKARVVNDLLTSEFPNMSIEDLNSLYRDISGYKASINPQPVLVEAERHLFDVAVQVDLNEESVGSVPDSQASVEGDGLESVKSQQLDVYQSQDTLASETMMTVKHDLTQTWAQACLASEPKDVPKKFHDFLYHGQMHKCVVSKVGSTGKFEIFLRTYHASASNNPYFVAGSLSYAINLVADDDCQHVFYIVEKRAAKIKNESERNQRASGRQLAFMFSKRSENGLSMRYARANMNTMLLLQRRHDISGNFTCFFSQEFGSIHESLSSDDKSLQKIFDNATEQLLVEDTGVVAVTLKNCLCEWFVTNGDRFGVSKSFEFGPTSPLNYKLPFEDRKQPIYNYLLDILTPRQIRCVSEMIDAITQRNGIVHGSKILKDGRQFKTPCRSIELNFDNYALHPCAVRGKAIGIASRIQNDARPPILFEDDMHYCLECFRIYSSDDDAIICTYFCMAAAEYLFPDGVRLKDAYGRSTID